MELLFFIVVVVAVGFGLSRLTRASRSPVLPAATSLQAAESDARRWIERLGASIVPVEADAGRAVREALADAMALDERARLQFARARSPYEYSLAGRSAIEGLHYAGAVRSAQGLVPAAGVPSTGPALERTGQVSVAGTTYYAAPHASDAMPYYFPGGSVAGRIVPGGWYGQPWWRPRAATVDSPAAAVGV